MISENFRSVIELLERFPDEQSCIDYLEEEWWGGQVVSPFDPTSKVYKCKNNYYRCKNTGKYFNIRTKTIFHNTKVSLRKWLLAIFLATSHKKGISSCQLAKDIHVTQRTAWLILQRIRICYSLEESTVLEGVVEIDETFVGGKNKNRHWDKKVPMSQGRSFKDKTPVFGMLQRGGKVIAKVVSDTTVKSLRPHIDKYVARGSTICTDEWNYGNLNEHYNHWQVFHASKVYAVGDNYTNTIEGFWSHLKRMIIGVYHNVSRKHLQLYINEQCFRYNTRKISEKERFDLLLQNIGKRLGYTNLTSPTNTIIYDTR